MKANKLKGLARHGCKKIMQTITLSKTATNTNQKLTKTIIHSRNFNKHGYRTLAEMVYESYADYLKRRNALPAPDTTELA